MSHRILNLVEGRFGKLTAISYAGKARNLHAWSCSCDCGRIVVVSAAQLLGGCRSSCGCLRREVLLRRNTKHGLSRARREDKSYVVWKAMKGRCYRPNTHSYRMYGARGISVCKEWLDPSAFCSWYKSHEPIPDGYSLDRINNDGPYAPWNCRFVSPKAQARNTRRVRSVTFNGRKMLFVEFMEKYSTLPNNIVYARHFRWGWNLAQAATAPLGSRRRSYEEQEEAKGRLAKEAT